MEQKGLHDFVTAVDREAEAAVLGYLREHYPDHAVMAEESSPVAQAADSGGGSTVGVLVGRISVAVGIAMTVIKAVEAAAGA